MDPTEGSETSANINQTLEIHPKVETVNTEHRESLKSRIIHLYGEETATLIRRLETLHFKPLKMDPTEGSETSANINQTLGIHQKVETVNSKMVLNWPDDESCESKHVALTIVESYNMLYLLR
jgi:hypothetical protein